MPSHQLLYQADIWPSPNWTENCFMQKSECCTVPHGHVTDKVKRNSENMSQSSFNQKMRKFISFIGKFIEKMLLKNHLRIPLQKNIESFYRILIFGSLLPLFLSKLKQKFDNRSLVLGVQGCRNFFSWRLDEPRVFYLEWRMSQRPENWMIWPIL